MGISIFVDLVLIDDPIKGPNTKINLWEHIQTKYLYLYLYICQIKIERKKKKKRTYKGESSYFDENP